MNRRITRVLFFALFVIGMGVLTEPVAHASVVTAWNDEHSLTLEIYENGLVSLMKQASGTPSVATWTG